MRPILFLDIYPRGMKTCPQRDFYTKDYSSFIHNTKKKKILETV